MAHRSAPSLNPSRRHQRLFPLPSLQLYRQIHLPSHHRSIRRQHRPSSPAQYRLQCRPMCRRRCRRQPTNHRLCRATRRHTRPAMKAHCPRLSTPRKPQRWCLVRCRQIHRRRCRLCCPHWLRVPRLVLMALSAAHTRTWSALRAALSVDAARASRHSSSMVHSVCWMRQRVRSSRATARDGKGRSSSLHPSGHVPHRAAMGRRPAARSCRHQCQAQSRRWHRAWHRALHQQQRPLSCRA